MKELYIDFDGVIMDTIPYLYKALEDNNVDTSDETAKREFFAKYDYSQIINDGNILNNSIACIDKLKNSNIFQISILTHINSLEEGIVKVNYLRRYFKDITIVLTPKQLEKTEMVHSKGAILVDDYSGNLRSWESKGGIPVKFVKEREEGEFKTIKSLDELIDLFGVYYE
jgi:hypothetical protein